MKTTVLHPNHMHTANSRMDFWLASQGQVFMLNKQFQHRPCDRIVVLFLYISSSSFVHNFVILSLILLKVKVNLDRSILDSFMMELYKYMFNVVRYCRLLKPNWVPWYDQIVVLLCKNACKYLIISLLGITSN